MKNTTRTQLRAAAIVCAWFPGIVIAKAIARHALQEQHAARGMTRFVIVAGSGVTGYGIALIACAMIAATIYAVAE